ncbi:MAG: PAS domain S-box protein [Candidatus Korobacteraceae bacterium]
MDDLKSTIRSRVDFPVNFYVDYMESQGFENPEYEKSLSQILSDQYNGIKLDLVVVAAYPALQFAVRHRDQIFPGAPVLFWYVHASRLEGKQLWPGVTGVTTSVDVQGTLKLVFRLHPDTQNLAVVAGTSEFERYWLAGVRNEFRPYAGKIELIEIVGIRPDEILKRAATLPPHTIVLFQVIPRDSTQPAVGIYDTIGAISQRFPTYCIFRNFCVDHGGIGGSYSDYAEQSLHAGEIAARLLSGEKAESIPVVHDSGSRVQVDWRQLRRWNIAESALPPGTIVLYRQPTVWGKYENYVVAGIILIVVQLLLIFGLLWQRARKRKTEAVLRESETRFRVMANTTPSLVWMCDKDGNVTYLNDRRIGFTGRDPQAGFEDTWTAFIHPDDREKVISANTQALKKRERFSKEYRLRRHDGVYRWILDVAAPRINGDGEFAGFIGSANDITDQKLAQEALERVGGKLIEAQEKERSRIARELHDDICQRLALISLELQQTYQSSNGTDAQTKARMLEIQLHCSEVAGDVQALSHQLHSSKLDYLGLAAALRSFCREYSQQQNVEVDFKDESVPNPLPRDVSLCLFRVAQEALSNAMKYSGATQVRVHLRGTVDRIRIEISDAGVGFDVEEARQRTGLGLVSMQERVHLVNGTFSIESKPNQGTRIVAEIPLPTEVSARAALAAVS